MVSVCLAPNDNFLQRCNNLHFANMDSDMKLKHFFENSQVCRGSDAGVHEIWKWELTENGKRNFVKKIFYGKQNFVHPWSDVEGKFDNNPLSVSPNRIKNLANYFLFKIGNKLNFTCSIGVVRFLLTDNPSRLEIATRVIGCSQFLPI